MRAFDLTERFARILVFDTDEPGFGQKFIVGMVIGAILLGFASWWDKERDGEDESRSNPWEEFEDSQKLMREQENIQKLIKEFEDSQKDKKEKP